MNVKGGALGPETFIPVRLYKYCGRTSKPQ